MISTRTNLHGYLYTWPKNVLNSFSCSLGSCFSSSLRCCIESVLRIHSNSDFMGIIWLQVLDEELEFYTKLIAQSFTAAGISGQKWLELTFMPFRVMFSALESAISKTCLSLRISFSFRGRWKGWWGICPQIVTDYAHLITGIPLFMLLMWGHIKKC